MAATNLTLNGIANLEVTGSAAQVNGSTISNFVAGDVIDFTNLGSSAPAVLTTIVVSAASTALTISDGINTASVTLNGSFGAGSFQLSADGTGGTSIGFLPSVPYNYSLPAATVKVRLGSLSNTVTAMAANLLSGDIINGGLSGSNTLALSGGGTFNLAIPAVLNNFSTITVQEGSGTVLDLRAGLNATVNVTGSAGITIVGAANSDVINLGSGNDTVTLGAGETVNGGGGDNGITVTATSETVNRGTGNNTIRVTASSIGATINGGSGNNTLVVTGGGNAVMGAKVTGISTVQLATTTNFTANGTANLQIAGSASGGDTITLGAASQSVTSGGINEHVIASAANAGALVSGLGAGSQLEITTGGTVTLNSATGGSAAAPLLVKLDAATNLALSPMQFINVVGSSGNDTITAGATNQTLTGGSGTDILVGYAGGSDTFQDTAAGLTGDTLRNFVATDEIDITNLVPGTATLTATASGANTAVTVASGTTKASFVMAGSFTQAGFTVAADGTGGTLITHS
jgi:hypothetical protein